MVTCNQSIQNFNEKMSNLVNSKFIVAEKKIAEVLISISDSILLFELFKHVSEDFDYQTVKSVCFAHDVQGNGYFKLPKSDVDVLALGFAVLSEIDSGEIDIIDLCNEYFPTVEGKQRSYSLFATQFLIPFQQTALKFAKAMVENQGFNEVKEEKSIPLEEQTEKQANTIEEKEFTKQRTVIGCEYIEQLKRQAVEIADTLKRGREPYDELAFILEELQEYVNARNLRGITLAVTALKHIKRETKKVDVNLDKISKIIGAVV